MNNLVFSPASSAQQQFLLSDADVTFYGGAAGAGKALKHGEKVLTPFGFKSIESIVVGDTVTTPNNTTEEVLAVYPQGLVDIYRVTFQDGSHVDTCGEHLWQFHIARGRGAKKIGSTLELKDLLSSNKRPIVPLTSPVNICKESDLLIKPYTLGVLLGDGSLTTDTASFVSADDEIKDGVLLDGYSVTQWKKESNNSKVKLWGIPQLKRDLTKLALHGTKSNNKFIPTEYLNSSIESRWSIIQGLMDTDGYVCPEGRVEYCTVSKQLATDVRYILHSLGFTVTVSEKETSYKNDAGEYVKCQLAYILYIRGANQGNLFRLSRKVQRTKHKQVGNRVVSVEKLGTDYATCISITGKDKLFITSNFIVTHNSHCLLGSFLKFCHHPRTRGVIFRKTTKQISNPGGLFDSAVNLYKQVDPKLKIKSRDLELVFSSGATLKFAYLDNPSDKYNFQGAELTFIGFDEIQQLSQENVIYLFSRLRSTSVDYKKQIVATGNPDFHSFMKNWVEFALDERGIPIRKDKYPMRYFVQVSGGSIDWADTREELELLHGTGNESGILSFMFVPGTIYDNPPLMKADPTYISKLKALPMVEKERLLWGSWYARESASGYWKRHWVNSVLIPPLNVKSRVRSWDLAFTQVNESGSKNPDYTAGVLMSKSTDGKYTVEDIIRLRDRAHVVEETIISTAVLDGHRVIITLPNDPAGGGAYVRGLQRRLSELGFICRLVRPTKGKIQRFAPFAAVAEGGFVDVVIGDWNNNFHDELETFDGTNKFKDDQADGCSDAFYLINKEFELPSFSLPDFTQTASFGFTSPVLPVGDAQMITKGEFSFQ